MLWPRSICSGGKNSFVGEDEDEEFCREVDTVGDGVEEWVEQWLWAVTRRIYKVVKYM